MNKSEISKILADNDIVLNPLSLLPIIDKNLTDKYEKSTYKEIFNILDQFKKANYKLSLEEEKERDVVSSFLLNKISKENWNPPVLANLIPRLGFHQPMVLDLFKVLPSRYQRIGRQVILLTGHFQDLSYQNLIGVMNFQGESLELKALHKLSAFNNNKSKN